MHAAGLDVVLGEQMGDTGPPDRAREGDNHPRRFRKSLLVSSVTAATSGSDGSR